MTILSIRHLLAGASLAAFAAASPAGAQIAEPPTTGPSPTDAGASETETPPTPATPGAADITAAPASAGLGSDIVVTARRRSESIQTVPVSVQAFSGETLAQQNVVSTTDLQRLTPGVVLNGSGSDFNSTLTIRGQGRDVIGPIAPSVQSYVNEVPLPSWGAVIPTYDISNIQVLKGPQGTLFGRNTTGGAILVYSQQPDYELGGYVQGIVGSFDWLEAEGALNLPIVEDRIALRVAGQKRERDGYVKAGLPGEPDGASVDAENFRVSLLIEPTDFIKSVTVYDYAAADLVPISLPAGYGTGTGPNGEFAAFHFLGESIYGAVGGTNALFDCGTSPACDPDLAIARAQASDHRRYYNSQRPFTDATVQGITNTTTIDIGDVTVKNIFAYRRNRIREASDTDGTELVLIDAYRVLRSDDQFTEELQASGTLFDGSLEWLAGGFYLFNEPKGPNSIAFNLYQPGAADVAANPALAFVSPFLRQSQESYVKEESKALFLSLSQSLEPLLEGLTLNASGRYTWDDVESCSVTYDEGNSAPSLIANPSQSYDECTGLPGASVIDGSFEKFTWSIGLDYQVTPDVFGYAVTRRGYRAGGVNTPALGGTFTPYQTFGPQTVTDYEVGLKADWRIGGIEGRINISAFYAEFDDLQLSASGLPPDADGDGNNSNDPSGTSLIVNAGSAKTKGIEMDGFVRPFDGFQFNYGLALFDGDIDSGTVGALDPFLAVTEEFDRAPEVSFTIGGHYEYPTPVFGGTLAVDLSYYWTDDYKVQIAQFDSYELLSGFIGINDIGGSGLDVQIFGQNLTDETYFQNPNASGTSPGYITQSLGAPRMFGGRLRYTFGGG